MPDSSPTADRAQRRLQVAAVVLLIALCVGVAVIVFWPGPPDPGGQAALRMFLHRAHRHGLPHWITFGKIEFGANIVMFMPIGFFGALSLPRLRWIVVPAALLTSIVIETIQALRLPERVGTPRDVVANTTGAVIGYLLALLLLWSLQRRKSRRAPRTELCSHADRLVPARSPD